MPTGGTDSALGEVRVPQQDAPGVARGAVLSPRKLTFLWQDVIVLFLWLGEPFSTLSTFSAFSAKKTAILAIARSDPSGHRPP